MIGLRKFYAANMPEALAKVRAEIGPDAVILDTRKLDEGLEITAMGDRSFVDERAGRSQVATTDPVSPEVIHDYIRTRAEDTAAGEEFSGAEGFLNNKVMQDNAFDSFPDPENIDTGWTFNDSNEPASTSALDDYFSQTATAAVLPSESSETPETIVEAELGNIRSMLQQWIGSSAWTDYSAKSPLQARLWENYSAMGIDSDLISMLIGDSEAEVDLKLAWRNSLAVLTRQVRTKNGSSFPIDIVQHGGVYAFVGATGSGKTTTIGKLATQCVLKQGAESVALISTDRFRLAAHEQLKALGRILGVQVFVANNSRELNGLLTALTDKQTVLIDTAGLSRNADVQRKALVKEKPTPNNNEAIANFERQLSMLVTCSQEITNLMVLSATSQKSVLMAELNAYRRLSLGGLVVTKTDEATSLGEFLSVAIQSQIPTIYEAFGQQLPEDISLAKNYKLVSKAVALSDVEDLNKQNLMSGFSNSLMKQQRDSTVHGKLGVL